MLGARLARNDHVQYHGQPLPESAQLRPAAGRGPMEPKADATGGQWRFPCLRVGAGMQLVCLTLCEATRSSAPGAGLAGVPVRRDDETKGRRAAPMESARGARARGEEKNRRII